MRAHGYFEPARKHLIHTLSFEVILSDIYLKTEQCACYHLTIFWLLTSIQKQGLISVNILILISWRTHLLLTLFRMRLWEQTCLEGLVIFDWAEAYRGAFGIQDQLWVGSLSADQCSGRTGWAAASAWSWSPPRSRSSPPSSPCARCCRPNCLDGMSLKIGLVIIMIVLWNRLSVNKSVSDMLL